MACAAAADDLGRRRGGTLARASVAWGLTCIAVLGVVLAPGDGHIESSQFGSDRALAVLAAVLVALGLGLHGMVLNDLLDMRRDQTLHPGRVLASGRAGPAQVVLVATAALILAMLGAGMLGGQSVLVVVALAAGLLVHNAMARFIPAIGLLVPGLLAAGLSMLPGWPPAAPWLSWSLFTICVALSLLTHVLGNKRPRPSTRAVAGLAAEWVVVSLLLLALPLSVSLQGDGSGEQVSLMWPALAVVVLVGLLLQRFRNNRNLARAADRMLRTTGVWMGLYAAAWCQAYAQTGWAIGFLVASALFLLVLAGLRELLSDDRGVVGWQ